MATDFFLKIDGIPGESKDSQMKDWIDLCSWNWGAAQTGTMSYGGGGGAGRVAYKDFSFTMWVSKATPRLMLAMACGQHIKKAVLVCRKVGGAVNGGGEPYLKITFSDLLISSYKTTAADEVPGDQCTINFSKFVYEYRPQRADGTMDGWISTGYDQKQNAVA